MQPTKQKLLTCLKAESLSTMKVIINKDSVVVKQNIYTVITRSLKVSKQSTQLFPSK